MRKLFISAIILTLLVAPLTAADNIAPEHNEIESASVEVVTEAVQQSTLLLQLKQKLAQLKYRYNLLQTNVETAKDGLVDIKAVITNLDEIITNLDLQVKDNNKKSLSVKSQKERKKMELEDLEENVQILELQFEDQKELVGELMALLYVKRDIYFDEGDVNVVKVLASPNSVSETLQQMTYLDLIETENQSQIDKMYEMSDMLASAWSELRQKRDELEILDVELTNEQTRLKEEKKTQEALLEETKGEEAVFEAMISTADGREEDLLRDIQIYEKNVESMEDSLSGTRALLSEDQQELIGRIETDMLANFDIEDAASFIKMDWPISPSKGLTAYYIDNSYKELFGVDHYALDIRANQGSPIFAPADGVVYDIVFDPDSSRYAYIMIAHRKGVMTVYGHVSEVAVKIGDYVNRGQVIGASGATPGSVGAGVRTTGPHLHFEVLQDGVKVDPLRYLPLDLVPKDSLPDEYLETMQSQLEDEIRSIQDALDL